MIKVIETIVVLTLLLFSFFIGVKYSDEVKERVLWLFETKEEEIDLPDMIPDLNEDSHLNEEIIIDQPINPDESSEGVGDEEFNRIQMENIKNSDEEI